MEFRFQLYPADYGITILAVVDSDYDHYHKNFNPSTGRKGVLKDWGCIEAESEDQAIRKVQDGIFDIFRKEAE